MPYRAGQRAQHLLSLVEQQTSSNSKAYTTVAKQLGLSVDAVRKACLAVRKSRQGRQESGFVRKERILPVTDSPEDPEEQPATLETLTKLKESDLIRWRHVSFRETPFIYLVPLGDLHIGSEEFNLKRFLAYRDWIINTDGAVTGLMGDQVEFAIKDSVGDTYRQTISPGKQAKMMAELAAPLHEAGKLLFVLSGNHEFRTIKATDIDVCSDLCDRLGDPSLYLGYLGYLFMTIGKVRYNVLVYHGRGGARRAGGKLAGLEDMAQIADADCYCAGHTHLLASFATEYFRPQGTRLVKDKRYFVSTGSYLDYSGYAQRAGFAPLKSGAARIRMNGLVKDMHVSI